LDALWLEYCVVRIRTPPIKRLFHVVNSSNGTPLFKNRFLFGNIQGDFSDSRRESCPGPGFPIPVNIRISRVTDALHERPGSKISPIPIKPRADPVELRKISQSDSEAPEESCDGNALGRPTLLRHNSLPRGAFPETEPIDRSLPKPKFSARSLTQLDAAHSPV